ncbi:RING-type domain-containing protein [Mycena venus]|uniref:RING-type domain-containing protein n=1 Tax=Mycena venus TaxID=2733690 RepID=A0A8H7CQ42_9AGAR|nr:RING-type domain-containing protein [Mycena venus]
MATRALSEDADSDADFPDPKRLKSENTPQAKDKKKRRKKKKKTPIVVPLELPASTNAAPVLAPPTPLRSSLNSGKGKRKATSAPPASLQPELDFAGHDVEGPLEIAESSSAAVARTQGAEAQEEPENAESSLAAIARLNQELNIQSILLKKHEATLTQFTQSLTCQVCLDLLHKPYALAPCGHIACYNCLVAWFTSEPEEQHHHFGPRRKTCPNCRATIKERPVEVWNIKELVAGLVKSGLVSGPSISAGPPPPPALPGVPPPANAPSDPWHNIFRYPHQHPMFHPPPLNGGEPLSVEDMGMLDAEDGVYRCLDCMHEIWNGVCTSCQREYAGHRIADDDGEDFGDSDGEDEPIFWPHFLPMHGGMGIEFPGPQWWNADDDDDDDDDDDEDESELERAIQDAEDGYDSFIDDGDEEEGGSQSAAAIIEIEDDGSDDEREHSPPSRRRAAPVRAHVIVSSDDEDEDVPDRRMSGRRRARTRVSSSPVESEVIVISGDESDDAPRRYTPRRTRSRIVDDEDASRAGNSDDDDNESVTASSTYNPGTAPLSAGDLMHLMRRFEDPDAGSADEDDGSFGGYQSGDSY